MAEEPRTLGDIARLQAKRRGDATALTFEGRTVSYATFDRHTNQVANGLIALGVKPGDRVGYLGKNSDLYFEALFGATKAGAVMAPINWRLAPPEVRYIVGDATAKVLFVGPEFIEQAIALLPELTTVEHVIAMEGAAGDMRTDPRFRSSYLGLGQSSERRSFREIRQFTKRTRWFG